MENVILVSSHGGHLAEMMNIIDCFKNYNQIYFTYQETTTQDLKNVYFFKNFSKSPIILFSISIKILILLIRLKPKIIISTGAELAIPVFFLSLLLPKTKRIYMECSAQVKTASLTGRIVYKISHLFIVQWKSLLKVYGKKAVYRGGLI